VTRSRLTYNKIIADQRAKIERLTKQVARLKDRIAGLKRRAGKKLDQKPQL
jgi:uncharacterized coiled-coil protein SlyX